MIKCYFGVPGCGKTTILVMEAREELKRIKRKYKEIYTINFECVGCIPIQYDDLKTYKFKDSLILIDEITMDADNRAFKTFPKEIRDFFILHRHLGIDIIYATQNYENVDKKIRDLTSDLWYVSKTVVPILKAFTISKRIYRNININEYTSELTLGYRFCNLLEMIFTSNMKITWRRKYYKYYNSWDELNMKDRPEYPVIEENRIKPKPKELTRLEKVLKNGRKRKDRNSRENDIINYLNRSN